MRKRAVSSGKHLSGIALQGQLAAIRVVELSTATYISRTIQCSSQDRTKAYSKYSRIGSKVEKELIKNQLNQDLSPGVMART